MKRSPALLLCAVLVTATWPLAAFAADDAIRFGEVAVDDHPEVRVPVTLPAAPDGALPDGAFELHEDGHPRDATIEYRGSEGLQLLLLMDTTGSMGGPPIAGAKQAATNFITELPDGTEVAVMEFATDATLLTGFEADDDEHLAAIDELAADGRTALYDAVTAATEVFAEDEDAARVIILLADGEDNASEGTVDDAVVALTDASVTLYSVEYLTDFTDEDAVRELANATGGAVLEADDAAELLAVYQQLGRDLVSRYLVSYVTDAGGSVELELVVDHPDGRLVGRHDVMLPAVRVEPPGEDEEVSRPAPPPTSIIAPPGWTATAMVIGGTIAWFVAIGLLALAWFLPRRGRSQLAGTATRHAGTTPGLSELANRATLLAERGMGQRRFQRDVSNGLERAGLNLRTGEFVVLVASATITAAAVGLLLQGWVSAILLVAVTTIASRLVVTIRAERRQARFNDQLGETLQLLAGSLRAGFSLMQAVDAVARETDRPSSEEFSRLVVETRLGRDMNEALRAMAERMRSDDFLWIVQAIEIHREVGGDLAEVLDTVAGTIRERNQIRRQVQALSAEGRLSAYVLLALPFGVGLVIMITNPSYLAELTSGGLLGWSLLGIGAVLMLVGVVWMRRLVRLEF